ncbi:MAG: uncharacterized protein KVP18_001895 [Porospora cf. gigantea A]|uniref:uncharacterized protein n=1 Tax=Porospora cf. gigantea A TaxID=2853593 RepID=UPI003559E2EF|nr:MAG: hypothetical protein KVP18_001895 [Porospora cf. gigantea A]
MDVSDYLSRRENVSSAVIYLLTLGDFSFSLVKGTCYGKDSGFWVPAIIMTGVMFGLLHRLSVLAMHEDGCTLRLSHGLLHKVERGHYIVYALLGIVFSFIYFSLCQWAKGNTLVSAHPALRLVAPPLGVMLFVVGTLVVEWSAILAYRRTGKLFFLLRNALAAVGAGMFTESPNAVETLDF